MNKAKFVNLNALSSDSGFSVLSKLTAVKIQLNEHEEEEIPWYLCRKESKKLKRNIEVDFQM